MNKKRKQNKFIKAVLCICFFTFLAVIAIFFVRYRENIKANHSAAEQSSFTSGGLTVCFVDSGQSDCTIIKTDEKAVLIDAGQVADYEKISDALHSLSITQIDIFIATHPHSDHIGSAERILSNYEVGTLLVPNIPAEFMPEYSLYNGMAAAAEKAGTQIVKAETDSKYSLGSDISLSLLGPLGNYETDLNSWSIVTRLTFGESSFLFTGDMEEAAEKDLINSGAELSSTVLKVGHHGSQSSTSAEFLEKVSPKYAVITCGAGNDFGHPHKRVLTALKNSGVTIYRTDLNGRIIFTTDGKTLSVKTEK